jgi:hypothetical protein
MEFGYAATSPIITTEEPFTGSELSAFGGKHRSTFAMMGKKKPVVRGVPERMESELVHMAASDQQGVETYSAMTRDELRRVRLGRRASSVSSSESSSDDGEFSDSSASMSGLSYLEPAADAATTLGSLTLSFGLANRGADHPQPSVKSALTGRRARPQRPSRK